MSTEHFETERPNTRAWVIHPDIKNNRDRREAADALAEAISLGEALPNLDVEGGSVVSLPKVHAGMLFGKGKIEELRVLFKDNDIELVLIDGPVTPVQQRNLEKTWAVKLLDRTGLILEIFSDRARTREGVLQVEMAHLAYQRTRLVRAWTHLERQRGGLGFVGGPGETQIEADRRAIDDQVGRLRKQLEKVVKTRALHRAARAKVPFPVVALVGYTNAGKSTLFNRVTGADVFAKDMLFATLDPTMRRLEIEDGPEIILSDTVGFISDLPTQLVAAFRATLEEVLDADLILHVRDISHPETENQARDVLTILADLGVAETAPMIEVWNKIDLLDDGAGGGAIETASRSDTLHAVSALTGQGLDDLLAAVSQILTPELHFETLSVAYSNGKGRAWLFEEGVIVEESADETGYIFKVKWTARQANKYRNL